MKRLLKPVLVEGLSKRVMLEKRPKLFPFWMVLFLHGDVNNPKLSAIQMLAYFEIPRFKKKNFRFGSEYLGTKHMNLHNVLKDFIEIYADPKSDLPHLHFCVWVKYFAATKRNTTNRIAA